MPVAKSYFQDKSVLLLLSINIFLLLLAIILIILRLTISSEGAYIQQYRSNVGIGAFKTGSIADIIAFIIFAAFVFSLHVTLSLKTYHLRRQFSIALLGLGTLLLVTTIIISNALLVLR
jgi:uncharacterized membrane protein